MTFPSLRIRYAVRAHIVSMRGIKKSTYFAPRSLTVHNAATTQARWRTINRQKPRRDLPPHQNVFEVVLYRPSPPARETAGVIALPPTGASDERSSAEPARQSRVSFVGRRHLRSRLPPIVVTPPLVARAEAGHR